MLERYFFGHVKCILDYFYGVPWHDWIQTKKIINLWMLFFEFISTSKLWYITLWYKDWKYIVKYVRELLIWKNKIQISPTFIYKWNLLYKNWTFDKKTFCISKIQFQCILNLRLFNIIIMLERTTSNIFHWNFLCVNVMNIELLVATLHLT